jgi:hypothetical protein
MISLRLAVPAVLVEAPVAGCFTYFVTPPPPPPRVVEADQRLPPTVPDMPGPDTETPTNIGQRPSAEEQAAAVFQRLRDPVSGAVAPWHLIGQRR